MTNPEWKLVKESVRKRAKNKCELCGRKDHITRCYSRIDRYYNWTRRYLHIHHTDIRKEGIWKHPAKIGIFKVKAHELMLLCPSCHTKTSHAGRKALKINFRGEKI